MGALSKRVNTGIGAPGAVNADGKAGNFGEGAFQMVLNAIAIRLALPTCERETVVGDDQLKPAA